MLIAFNESDELESAPQEAPDAGFVAKLVDLSKSRRHAILEVETPGQRGIV